MRMSQYEERFLRAAPSLHQTFAAAAGRDGKRRRRRIWAAAAGAGALAIICSVGPHRAVPWLGHQPLSGNGRARTNIGGDRLTELQTFSLKEAGEMR